MKLRAALVLLVLASLIWMVTLPLLTLRFAFLTPTTYRRWLRESDFFSLLSVHLSHDLPRQVPEAFWSPWTPRSPDVLQPVFDYVFETVDLESTLVDLGVSWGRWALGIQNAPLSLAGSTAHYLEGPSGAYIGEFLWQLLPLCDQSAWPVYCKPQDLGARPEVGQQQRLWWDQFVVDIIQWLEIQETQFLSTLPDPPTWIRWIDAMPVASLIFAGAALLLWTGRARWLSLSVPLMGGGVFTFGMGGLLVLDVIPPPLAWAEVGTLLTNAATALLPSLWYTAGHLLGMTLVVTGAVSVALGLLFLPFTLRGWWGRGAALGGGLLILGGAFLVFPYTIFTPSSASAMPAPSISLMRATPTPWPTLTQIPTSTPTPTVTPTPFVQYWPVAPGTPMPTPGASFADAPELLGCYRDVHEPVLALDVVGDEVWTVQLSQTSRRTFSTLTLIDVFQHPITVTGVALANSGKQIALAQDWGLNLYGLPSWQRDVRSRVSTFSRIETMTYVNGRGQLVLGLANGYLWVLKPTTGAIVWLIPAHTDSVTALATHPRRAHILSASSDGTVRLWYMDSGKEQAVFQPRSGSAHSVVTVMAFSPHDAQAIFSDDQGMLVLWDLAQQRVIRQRSLASNVLTALRWTEDGIVGGSVQGNLILLTERFHVRVIPFADVTVTALLTEPPGYVLAGSEDGQVCVWATLNPSVASLR